ncbi:MAG: AAA family ATPase, partial [bacterium]|nr:AAA family ATPase [bacterium]
TISLLYALTPVEVVQSRAEVLCLTATAKPAVITEIVEHFKERLGIQLDIFNGGAKRDNLSFEVIPTSGGEKFALVHDLLSSYLPADQPGGAIVYCASRSRTEEVAEFLDAKDISADHFHAGLTPDTKKDVQQRFIDGDLKVIAATNAFGMGIDKPDVRLVIHADIPSSLESYLQEAGRAGRDRETARCLLLYDRKDVESQFGLSARSRLSQREIHGILRALRNLNRKKQMHGEVVATVGEILREDQDNAFERDSVTDDTRVKTAVAWLEETHLLNREENRTEIFPSALRIQSIEEAQKKLERAKLYKGRSKELLDVTGALLDAPADGGITTDELMNSSGLSAEGVRGALHDLESLGIARNDMTLTAFVHKGIQRDSRKRFDQAAELEDALITLLQEAAPGQEEGQSLPLHLRQTSQRLRDAGVPEPLPERLSRVLRGIAQDGRGEGGGKGSLRLRTQDAETVWVTLQRRWRALQETAELRRNAARLLLDHLVGQLPAQIRGADLLAETTMGGLFEALKSDMLLYSQVRNPSKLLDHALLWLHDLEIIRLHRGLAVFRPAMTIRLAKERRGFSNADFEPLALHYRGQVLQIHIMVEFAERGLQAVGEALQLSMDYFTLEEEEFLERWLPGRKREIQRETTPESYDAIVTRLNNPVQQRIVADNRQQTNVLVLAGPGSGKTRVLVHRIAYLLRVRRQPASGILALAYNRHAAVEIRRRLQGLVGRDAYGVTVLTCHALAMRLVGASFTGMANQPDDHAFSDLMRQATALVRGEGLLPEEADVQRDRLLRGFRWILVDEYQDIGPEQYALISALAGRTLEDEGAKLNLFAVGDDDQNIYAFAGASVAFIRKFEDDYRARTDYLTDNYRSTHHIITAANALIEPARQRMKTQHPIQVDRRRRKDPPGGDWQERDPVGQGRVQILGAGSSKVSQARQAVAELQRLAALAADWNWARCAVIAREWKYLEPARACCDLEGIAAQTASEEIPGFWRLRETQTFVAWLRERQSRTVDGAVLQAWALDQKRGPWQDLLRQAIEEYIHEHRGAEAPVEHLLEWLAEWGRDVRRRQQGLLLLTAHRAKGLEFDTWSCWTAAGRATATQSGGFRVCS